MCMQKTREAKPLLQVDKSTDILFSRGPFHA